MKILMYPEPTKFGHGESGIRRVVEAYFKYLPEYGIELVTPDTYSYDLVAVHAGMAPGADVAHNHGLYWTEDITLSDYEWQANVAVINSLREAKQITVPSEWVAESLRRDMRLDPHVIGHGIEWDEWQGGNDGDYVLWNKNRDFDVCNPEAIIRLARIFPKEKFLSTFGQNPTPNLKVTGQVPFEQMRQMVMGCSVYLSSIKETFGIGTLEAMAAGKPVLGWANGGNLDLVKHGVNGYLAQPGNYEDLANGLEYCLSHRKVLGDNGREMAKAYTWPEVCRQVAKVYELAYSEPEASVGIVIPVYNKSEEQITRAIESCFDQSHLPDQLIVVNDGSTNDSFDKVRQKIGVTRTQFIEQTNQGVAVARNNGISKLNTKYVACLDADDWIEPKFLEACVKVLEQDHTIGIAYTGLQWHNHETGESKVSDWPAAYRANKQFAYHERQNQIPTCCVFRRDAWERVGGFRSRYCPNGAGSEDAAFWAQILSQTGYTAKQVTTQPLFNYSLGGNTSQEGYNEIDWLKWLPYSRDKRYPFACSVLPDRYSHPVRQYDEPEISIIIPVGPGHEDSLRIALDSIEAQHFRNWEAIVVLDTGNEYYPELYKAYPYVKWVTTSGKQGAGYARNRGVEIAKGKFLLFLDADDYLNPGEPYALNMMLDTFWETGYGVYSAHIGRAVVSSEYVDYAKSENRLLAYNEELSQAYILNHGIPFDCEKAFREPTNDPDKIYIWNAVSTLIPKSWHDEIGGFDESMPTWEDWDYWLRMAKGGKCFTRIQKPFLIYNYISGKRREKGRQIWRDVLKYLRDKHKEIKIVGCGCGKNKPTGVVEMAENPDTVDAKYLHPNKGKHHVIINGYNYGRFSGGEIIPNVRTGDVKSNPHLFQVLENTIPDPEPQPKTLSEPAPLSEPEPIQTQVALDLSEFRSDIQQTLQDNGMVTSEAILEAGADGLIQLKGIGFTTAQKLLDMAKE